MSTGPKIDMSAMSEIKNDTKSTPEVEETKNISETKNETAETEIVADEVESKIPHISLGSIKTNKSVEIKEEIEEDSEENEHDDKRDELMEVLNRETTTNKIETTKPEPVKTKTKPEITKSEQIETKKVEEIKAEPIKTAPVKPETKKTEKVNKTNDNVNKIEKEIDDKVQKETDDKFNLEDKKLNKSEKKKELFGNYKTDYKEKTILEKIKEEKKKIKEKFKKPKTRILLVATLLIIFVSIIGGLFLLDPDNHSIDTYQKRIIMNVNNVRTKYIDKPWVPSTISVETITFDIFTQEKLLKIIFPDSTPNYKYNKIVYKTKAELETALKKEAKIKKEEISRKEAEIARQEAEQDRLKAEIALAEKKEKVKIIIRKVLTEKFK